MTELSDSVSTLIEWITENRLAWSDMYTEEKYYTTGLTFLVIGAFASVGGLGAPFLLLGGLLMIVGVIYQFLAWLFAAAVNRVAAEGRLDDNTD